MLKHRLYIVSLVIVFSSSVVFQSCQNWSRSGRSHMIVMAKKESRRKKTTPKPNTIIKGDTPKAIKINDIVTAKEESRIEIDLINNKIPPAEGKLIQVEGLVAKEVSRLTIDLKTGSRQINQILKMKDFVQSKWHYIFDPASGHDTWRSAEATLALKYKGKYTGDCDDFAILMASFARQIGLRSRMVGGFSGSGGHAFAEFLLSDKLKNEIDLNGVDYRTDSKGKWISLDWFNGDDHSKYLHDIKIYENI
jgi:hypothetical protein